MTDVERWETIGIDLRGLLWDAPAEKQRAAVAAAAALAAERTGLDQDPVPSALAMLRAGQVDPGMRERLTDLVNELDEAGFAMQEQVEDGLAEESEYLQLFFRARAASALSTAMRDDARNAALEGIYEAYHAIDCDEQAISQAIHTALQN